jgi:CxxC-x17-CxxC domain-containing protein
VFTADDQEFHAQKGYTNDPKRCPACRAARRAANGGGGGSYSSGGGYGQREMTTVTCSRCGNEAQVPFVPRTDRPVYCNDCFARERAGSGGGGRRY